MNTETIILISVLSVIAFTLIVIPIFNSIILWKINKKISRTNAKLSKLIKLVKKI